MIKRKIKQTIQKINPHVSERIVLVDFLKGVVILLMIVTHVIALTFDYTKGDNIVFFIGSIGGIASFTGFLFLSGINNYLSSVRKDDDDKRNNIKIFNRVIKIFLVYYILAFAALVLINKQSLSTPTEIFNSVKDVLTFKVLVEFTEFLPALGIFALSLIFFRKFYKYLSNKIVESTLVGLVLYFVGQIFVNIDLHSSILNSIKALFFGHLASNTRIHSFPVFQYFIIFIIGLNIGRFLYNNARRKARFLYIIRLLSVTIPLTIVLTLIYVATKISLFYPFPEEGRFPPSLSFITLSLSIILIVLAVLDYLIPYIPVALNKILTYLSKNSLEFVVVHLLLLFGFRYYLESAKTRVINKPTNFVEIFIVFLATILLSFLFVWLYNYIYRKIFLTRAFRNILRFVFNVATPNLILVFSILILGFILYSNLSVLDISKNLALPLTKRIFYDKDTSNWWDNAYKVKRNITINNQSEKDYSLNQWAQVSFNHKEAINNNNALRKDGSDIRIVYFNTANSTFIEVPIYEENPNNENTIIKFQLQDNLITGSTDANYFLYYGNADVTSYLKSDQELKDTITQGIVLGSENFHEINATTNRFWFIKNPKTKSVSDELVFTAGLTNSVLGVNSIATYTIEKANLSGTMEKSDDKFNTTINLSNLNPEVYTIQVEIVDLSNNFKTYQSYKVPFTITYPLYVTWSIDWEGWDVAQYNMDAMDNIANGFGIPVTQLFNPRIFVKEQTSFDSISPIRAEYLTGWLIDRKNKRGDEIGMHVHMFADMVKEAGVTPKPGDIIGASYGDSKTSDYTQEELEKIFNWALTKFKDNGLPTPITYRTGGWLSGPQVLNAAYNAGFLIDTSGRTGGVINPGVPNSTQLPWNLQVTTWPYKPVIGDINRWEGERIGIWEFPNNGADSYWFTADDLISRFNQNYSDAKGVLVHPQVLTYLSHPNWMVSVDYPKLQTLFQYISNYLYKNDKGPVVFSTIEGAYNEWDTLNDINGN